MSTTFNCPHCKSAIPAINPDPFGRCPTCKKMLLPAFSAPAEPAPSKKRIAKPTRPKLPRLIEKPTPVWRSIVTRTVVVLVVLGVGVGGAVLVYHFFTSAVEVAKTDSRPTGEEPTPPVLRYVPPPTSNSHSGGMAELVKPPPSAPQGSSANPGGMMNFNPFGSAPSFGTPGAAPGIVWATARVGTAGKAFEDKSPSQSLLVGLKVTAGRLGGPCLVHSVQPIYQAASNFQFQMGQQIPAVHGAPIGKVITLQAKAGYAVGGLIASGRDRLYGFKLLF